MKTVSILIPSYNEDELDVTDYTYTYIGDDINDFEVLEVSFLLRCTLN